MYNNSGGNLHNPLIVLPDLLPDEQNVYHIFPIAVQQGKRNALRDYLECFGIGTMCHYPIAPHRQECYANAGWNTPQLSLPITERLADEELSIPISPAITMDEAAEVVRVINRWNH